MNEDFSALEQLDLQNASLTNLKLFPKLPKLQKLDLSGNRLSKGLEVLKDCPNLKSLSLINNKFKEFDTLQPLSNLKITHLDVDGNEFTDSKDDFRKKVFELLPTLILLDGANKDGVEDNSDDDAYPESESEHEPMVIDGPTEIFIEHQAQLPNISYSVATATYFGTAEAIPNSEN